MCSSSRFNSDFVAEGPNHHHRTIILLSSGGCAKASRSWPASPAKIDLGCCAETNKEKQKNNTNLRADESMTENPLREHRSFAQIIVSHTPQAPPELARPWGAC